MPSKMYKSAANKNRIGGYKEKSGEVHKKKEDFYKSKAKKANELTDNKKWRTADNKVFNTRAEYDAHKKKLIESGKVSYPKKPKK